ADACEQAASPGSAPPALGEQRFDPTGLLCPELRRRDRLLVIDLRGEARALVDARHRLTQVERHVRVGRNQRYRQHRQRLAEREWPYLDCRAPLPTTQGDIIWRRGHRSLQGWRLPTP